MNQMQIKQSIKKTIQVFKTALPIMVGMLLLINLLNVFLKDYYSKVFTGNVLLDPFIGSLLGSVSFGIPVTSYIVGGELLLEGVSLLAVTAFIMAWTTVGLAMLPLEASFLGKRFALTRNIVNFIFSLIIAVLVIYTLKVF
jgi:hypothetical protein